jgi:hypothetical protein
VYILQDIFLLVGLRELGAGFQRETFQEYGLSSLLCKFSASSVTNKGMV